MQLKGDFVQCFRFCERKSGTMYCKKPADIGSLNESLSGKLVKSIIAKYQKVTNF